MSDCVPIYMILRQNNQPVARATFYLVKNEPLPISPVLRRLIAPVFKRWPLLICRSPLSSASGLILPSTSPLREEALEKIAHEGLRLLKEYSGSFLIFDYLEQKEIRGWKKPFTAIIGGDPGTYMPITWKSFDEYLGNTNWKGRKNYKQNIRATDKQNITISRHESVLDLEEAEKLIRRVEDRHQSSPNPWVRGMMQYLEMVDGVWIAAMIDDQLVGCELVLKDGNTQIVTALGLDERIRYTYFRLGYEDIELAIEKNIHQLHWGSGAYDVKRRLGFKLEENNWIVFASRSAFVQRIVHYFI